MLDGLVEFRQEFPGQYWLEVMVVGGYTATPEEIGKLAECVNRIRPDRVQLNTVTRPPAEKHAVAVSRERLAHFTCLFEPPAEVIADFRDVHREAEFIGCREEVLAMLQRRPCFIEDIARGLGIHRNEVTKYLEELLAQAAVESLTSGDKQYYRAVPRSSNRGEESPREFQPDASQSSR
jgi:wyosine [tRNA(Phe)-imidazoG37] synthetase (radical SAM superfamily)